ncbi:hypothetical protein CRX72_18260 [Pantoea sp. BRM17]|nr:hypothetical protein CRX72_18260 [Pantoea sp. BRM17]
MRSPLHLSLLALFLLLTTGVVVRLIIVTCVSKETASAAQMPVSAAGLDSPADNNYSRHCFIFNDQTGLHYY